MPDFDNAQAEREGWAIFDCDGSANGRWQLQKCDDRGVFSKDEEAWKFVCSKADQNSPYHLMAMMFLKIHNLQEWRAIRKLNPESATCAT